MRQVLTVMLTMLASAAMSAAALAADLAEIKSRGRLIAATTATSRPIPMSTRTTS